MPLRHYMYSITWVEFLLPQLVHDQSRHSEDNGRLPIHLQIALCKIDRTSVRPCVRRTIDVQSISVLTLIDNNIKFTFDEVISTKADEIQVLPLAVKNTKGVPQIKKGVPQIKLLNF